MKKMKLQIATKGLLPFIYRNSTHLKKMMSGMEKVFPNGQMLQRQFLNLQGTTSPSFLLMSDFMIYQQIKLCIGKLSLQKIMEFMVFVSIIIGFQAKG